MAVLAIDQGTTSTRALLLSDAGEPTIFKTIEHRQIYPQPGWVEHDPEELITNIRACIEACPGEVAALGIDNQGESCLAWHADTGEAISPVIVWQDARTQDAITALDRSGAGEIIMRKTGLPLDAYFSASKLAWIVRNIPAARDLLSQGKLRLGTTDAFFLDRLTGRFVTDITTASRTSLMDLATGAWDAELCSLFGVPMETLPTIVPTVGDFGTIETGGKQIPVRASVVDQQASLYGHGARAKGDAKITFGTGAFALTVTGSEIFRADDKGLLPTVAWQQADAAPVYALDGGVYCASSAVNWAKSLGLFASFDQINRFEKPSAIERKLAFVPALTGLACPHWDRSAVGLWIGLSLDTSPLDMMQAVLEGIAFRAAEVLGAMDEFVTVNGALSIDGGMTANPYFCQSLANVLGREVRVPAFSELTALGTALLTASDQIEFAPQAENTTIFQPTAISSDHLALFGEAVNRSRNW